MCQTAQRFQAVTGMTSVTTANPNLDGSGAMSSLFTAGSSGSVIKSITIKSTASNAQGMIRFFINDQNQVLLWREVPVPASVQSATYSAYQTTVKISFTLQPGYEVLVATENAESWNIIAECVNWENCKCDNSPRKMVTTTIWDEK